MGMQPGMQQGGQVVGEEMVRGPGGRPEEVVMERGPQGQEEVVVEQQPQW